MKIKHFGQIAAVMIMAFMITACNRDPAAGDGSAEVLANRQDGLLLERRQPSSSRADAPGSREFEFVRYAIDVSQDQPRACLVFSSSLDPQRDYRPFLDLAPDTQIALAVDNAQLCIGGLSFNRSLEVTLRPGLPSLDGRTLAFSEAVPIEFGDRPAFVGFSGDGVILPRVEADGVAIQTVNVPSVRVEVSRITDRSLAFKRITQGYSVAQGDYGWLDYDADPSDVAEPVWAGTMSTAGSPNAAKTTVFPIAETIGRLKPGAYFLDIAQLDAAGKIPDNAARAKRWLIITDLALTTYTGEDGMMATVRSLQTAKPVRGVKLELVAATNEILARGESDAEGHVRFPGPAINGQGRQSPRLVTAYASNGDFAVLDLDRSPVDLTERDIGGRAPAKAADAFLYTERGVYRPGETVHATALLRDASGNAVDDRPGSLVVYGPNGIEASRLRFERAPRAGGVQFDHALAKTSARGEWRIAAEVDGVGEVGQVRFSVEDFVPQRIALQLTVDRETPLGPSDTRRIMSNVRFLYGAPGAGLPVETSVRIETDPNPFPGLAGYRFGRHDETFREASFDLPVTTTDGAGAAVINLDPRNQAPASSHPLRIRAAVSALEPGGRPVRDDVRVPYRPNERYLAVKQAFEYSADEGKPASFEIAAVDRAGALKAGEVNWRLVRIDWKYDWYREGGGEWRWRRSREVVEIESGVARMAEGAAASISTRNLDWGDYELYLTEASSGAEASVGFWAGWGGEPQDGVEAPDRVRLTVPETLPSVGSTIEIEVLPPYAGEAEIVIASENVILTRTLTVPAGGARVRLPVTRDWGAGVYVMASVYTPRDTVDRPRPRRAVGVAYMGVDVSPRTFDLAITAPDVARPRGEVVIDLASAGGPVREDAYLTLAAVDEGILLLTGFQSPDPAAYFFGKRALGVTLRDDYGRLLDPNQGASAEVRSGGDQIGGAGLSVVPTKTVALFTGPIQFDRGKARVSLNLPDFNGELRLMAVVWSKTGLGSASRPVTVRDQVPSELILPRFLAPGDTAIATATLDNVEGTAGAYRASLTGAGGVTFASNAVSATLGQRERRDIDAPLSASGTGVSTLSLSVTGPGGFAVARNYPIETRSAFLPVSYVDRAVLQPGESYTPRLDSLASFTAGSGRVTLSFSPLPLDAVALFDSLDRYPYGCTEQITSRAMPLLYTDRLAILAGRQSSGEIRTRIQEAVSTLLSRQGADGAIGLWRVGDRYATPWLGAYAVDFLARAKAAGYVVPDAALDRAYDALEAFAVREDTWSSGYDFEVYESRWNPDTASLMRDRSNAYAAYVLARAGRMDRARLRYLHDSQLDNDPSPLSRAHVGAALALIGDRARSSSSFQKAERALGYSNSGDYYQTPRRDLAGVLALAAEANNAGLVQRLTERVGDELPEPDRLTTQEKAFLLLAANALTGAGEEVRVAVRGSPTVVSPGRVFALDDAGVRQLPTFTNSAQGPVWVTAISHGSPAAPPPPASEGLRISKRYWTTAGRLASGSSFTQGDRLIVQIDVASTENRLTPLIVADLLPAGFEIEAVLRPEDGGDTGAYRFVGDIAYPKIAEARDDRFVAAIDLFDQKTQTLAYMVRAVTPGEFTLPGAVAEDMYRPDVFARSEAGRVAVARRN
ncbi:alpha-2-macroglobulin family protein [bacterium]|nr:alpha-2-macroglobulin family protein [bacterium]